MFPDSGKIFLALANNEAKLDRLQFTVFKIVGNQESILANQMKLLQQHKEQEQEQDLIKNLLPVNTLESFLVFEEKLINQPFAIQMVCIGCFVYALFINLTNRMNQQIYKHLI